MRLVNAQFSHCFYPSTPSPTSCQLKSVCLKIINESTTFGKLSQHLWDNLSKNSQGNNRCPISNNAQVAIRKEISVFKNKFRKKIEMIKKITWKEYIAHLAKQIATTPQSESLQLEWKNIAEFRASAVQLQNKLTALAALITGIKHSSDEWSAFGTEGNESDIDNSLTSTSIPQIDQMLIKTFADTSYTHIFGCETLSSQLLDLETYLEHPGSAREIETRISESSKGQLYYLELSMAELEMRKAYESNIVGWKTYKTTCLNSHKYPLKFTLEGIFDQVERFYKVANKAYKYAHLIELSQQMDHDFLELAKLPCQNERDQEEVKAADEIELRILARGLLRCHLFNESYLTCGAYNVVCHREGGQLSKRRDDEILRKIQASRSAPSICRMPIISKRLRPSATPLEYIISAKENGAKFYHAAKANFANKLKEPHIPKAASEFLQKRIDIAINSSKYAERVTSSSLAALEMMQIKLAGNQNSDVNSMQNEVEYAYKHTLELHKKASGLEKCKRQVEINDTTTKKLLRDRITTKINFDNRSFEKLENQKKQIEAAIDTVFKMFQRGGNYFNQEITSTDKYNLYLSQLEQHLFNSLNYLFKTDLRSTCDGTLTSGDSVIDAIIRAKAGFPRIGDPQVQALHSLSRKPLMMKEMGLGSIKEIENYFEEIITLPNTILELSQTTGLVPEPTYSENVNLISLWQSSEGNVLSRFTNCSKAIKD